MQEQTMSKLTMYKVLVKTQQNIEHYCWSKRKKEQLFDLQFAGEVSSLSACSHHNVYSLWEHKSAKGKKRKIERTKKKGSKAKSTRSWKKNLGKDHNPTFTKKQ